MARSAPLAKGQTLNARHPQPAGPGAVRRRVPGLRHEQRPDGRRAVRGPFKGKTLYKPGKREALTYRCAADCGSSATGQFFLKADSKGDLAPAKRAGKTFTFTFEGDCNGAFVEKLKLVFKANGDLDRKKSDFD